MVIQRIQSLILLLAAIIMGGIALIGRLPLAGDASISVYISTIPTMLILCILACLLQIIDIFLFKNLKKQMLVANIAAVIVLAFIAIGLVMTALDPAYASTAWLWPGLAALASCILTLWAKTRMKADYNLLRSADRIR